MSAPSPSPAPGAAPAPSAGGFSLFPNTSTSQRPPSRARSVRRATTPQEAPAVAPEEELTPPRIGRQGSMRRTDSVTSNNPWQHALDEAHERERLERESQQQEQQEQQQQAQQAQQQQEQPYHHRQYHQHYHNPEPRPAPPTASTSQTTLSPIGLAVTITDPPPRCETALSEARTLVRSPSTRSRSSIAKPPLTYTPAGPSSSPDQQQPVPTLRSIFPTYNPQVPLNRQDYYPTQASPTHIPQAAISRPLYSPRSPPLPSATGPLRSPGFSQPPLTANSTTSARWPPALGNRAYEPPVIPPASTTEDLRALWKVTNGWKASASEARPFCLRLTASTDSAPRYLLSSSSAQPFYSLRVDPTSASALVSLSRYDPHKGYRTSSTTTDIRREAKNWHQVLVSSIESTSSTTTHHKKEEGVENDGNDSEDEDSGLISLLWPAAAARLAADRANDATTVALARHECARLVYDTDSGNHFLVHPALAVPFCVTIERHPAYARTEYTLEHLESPAHLARLTRDGTGAGWLEVDTGIAAKIDAVYLVDVVVAALIIVAHTDDGYVTSTGNHHTTGTPEVFQPPPQALLSDNPRSSTSSSPDGRTSRASRTKRAVSRMAKREEKKKKNGRKGDDGEGEGGKRGRLEQFELDLESQTSELGKEFKKEKEKMPGCVRMMVGLVTIVFKCLFWCLMLVFRCLAAVLRGVGGKVDGKA